MAVVATSASDAGDYTASRERPVARGAALAKLLNAVSDECDQCGLDIR